MMHKAIRALLCALLFAVIGIAHAQAIDPLPFKDHAQEVRFQKLTAQLRCLVCQNENLADSNADLARDLRHEVFGLMQQGKSDTEIKQYLVARYSKFVLYDPPLDRGTLLLWFGPALILIAGAVAVVVTVRRRSRAAPPMAAAPAAITPIDHGDDW
jgi:cytochrome c-type biogenesis protein CcmH